MNGRSFPLCPRAKCSILNTIFDCKYEPGDFQNDSTLGEKYFEYYQNAVGNCRAHSTTDSHRKILDLVSLLKQPTATKSSTESTLAKKLPDDELDDSDDIIQDSINLAVRLLVMMPTGVFITRGRSVTVSGDTKLNWNEGTITDLITNELAPENHMREAVKLEKIFNARNIERIAGIEIRWTSNLADHMRMRDDDTAAEIFHYASFLELHRTCEIPLLEWQVKTLRNQAKPIIPSALISETFQTLALLLPEHDKDVENWFRKQENLARKRGALPLDPLARECGQLKVEERQIGKFNYWHDRLVILKTVFDEAEPRNITQWWHDRRKRVQWYTFWVAAMVLGLTIFFGLVQCIEGGIQVWYAAHA